MTKSFGVYVMFNGKETWIDCVEAKTKSGAMAKARAFYGPTVIVKL